MPITPNTVAKLSTNATPSSVELLVVAPDSEIETALWYAEPGEIVSEYDENATREFLEQDIFDDIDEEAIEYTIIATATSGGAVSGGSVYHEGEEVVLIAEPYDGYTFSGWYEDNALISGEEEYSFTADGNRALEARFALIPDIEKVSAPTASPMGGKVAAGTQVTLSCATDGADIHYTTDGTAPTSASAKYSGVITVNEAMTLRAIAVKSGMATSDVLSVTYTIQTTNPPIDPGNPGDGNPIDIEEPLPPPLSGAWRNPYTDVIYGDWFYDAVQFVSENGLMNGTDATLFAPGMTLNRAMVATILWRAAGEPIAESTPGFTDLNADWYRDAVAWAAEKGIVNGYDAVTFGPEDAITREQFAVMLYRYSGAPETDEAAQLGFTDAADISDYARRAMVWAFREGIITGKPRNLLDPRGSATRAEAATMIRRYFEA